MTITLEEAKLQLGDLIAKVAAGESVIITDHEKAVAQLVPPVPDKPRLRKVQRHAHNFGGR
jgi:prevent-host-death family protein